MRLLPLLAILLSLSLSGVALAHPPFKAAFEERYVKNGSDGIKATYKKLDCNVCHVSGGASRSEKNLYGSELDRLLTGVTRRLKTAEGKAEVLKDLDAAFTKVEEIKSLTGETWGERVKAGKLP